MTRCLALISNVLLSNCFLFRLHQAIDDNEEQFTIGSLLAPDNHHNHARMSDNLAAQREGCLLALPSEIRVLIYEMVFPARRVNLYHSEQMDEEHRTGRSTAILATCNTIYNEAKPILYENTEFYLGLTCDPVGFEDSLSEDDEEAALDDLYQQARPHIDRMRNLSLKVTLLDGDSWEETEDKDRWFEEMANELALLSEAPHLRKVHVTLATKNCSKVTEDLDRIISVISRYMYHVAVTVEIDPSLRHTDFKPSSYSDTLAKLKWLVYTCHRDPIQQKLTHIGSTPHKKRTQPKSQT